MLQIFRVEHRDTRVGPFQTDSPFTQALAARANQRQQLKLPQDDGLLMGNLPFYFVFGCPSLDSLKAWILAGDVPAENRPVTEALAVEGFVVAEFLVEAEDYRMGVSGLQVAFDADSCREEGLVVFHGMDALLA